MSQKVQTQTQTNPNQTNKQKNQDNPADPQHNLLFCSFRENCEMGQHLHSFGVFRIEISAFPFLAFMMKASFVSLPVSPSSKPAAEHLPTISPDSAVSLS